MRNLIVIIFILLGGSFSQAASSLWTQNFFWKELTSILIHRCQTYTPDTYHGCYYATTAMVRELKKDISPNSNQKLEQLGVVFKPELMAFANNPRTTLILDHWIEQLSFAQLSKSRDFSLFDSTARFLGSESQAVAAFAVLLQDISPSKMKVFEWLSTQISEKNEVIEKWITVLELIQSLPAESNRIFYPSATWSSSASYFNKAFYHFYVPTYLHLKIRQQKHVSPAYAATAVFLFNYFYENLQENGAVKAALFEPKSIKAANNLNDIRLAYLGVVWFETRGNLPALYAETSFLKIPQERLKDSLQLWMDRLIGLQR